MQRVINTLLEKYERIQLYPVIVTKPEALMTSNDFLNTLVIIHSNLSHDQIKSQLNELEESLGRDRSDPLRSHKDRTADVDIIACSETYDPNIFSRCKEVYVGQVLLSDQPSVSLPLGDSFVGDRAAAIHLDRTTGQIRIVHDELDGLDDWLKTGFETE